MFQSIKYARMKAMMTIIISLAVPCLLAEHALAQSERRSVPVIGYMNSLYETSAKGANTQAFLQGLRDLGYVEGRNIIIEYRFNPSGKGNRLKEFAADLVQRKVDVIVALNPPAAQAAKKATKTIPIVIRSTSSPVEAGFVASMEKPGGNITGVVSLSNTLNAKRIELLKQAVPSIKHVGIMLNPDSRLAKEHMAVAASVARRLGITVRTVPVRTANDLEPAIQASAKDGVQGILVIRSPLINAKRERIAELAIANRLSTIFDEQAFVKAGALLSYGADLRDLARQSATYVDKILKGAKPADLPIGQPASFDLEVNIKTAKALGITIPKSILDQAREVIQ